jgi:hypothetical protein
MLLFDDDENVMDGVVWCSSQGATQVEWRQLQRRKEQLSAESMCLPVGLLYGVATGKPDRCSL